MKKRGNRAKSITFKMSMYMALLITTLMAAVGFGNYYSTMVSLKEQTFDKGWSIVRSSTALASEYLLTGNNNILSEHMKNILSNEDVRYAAVINAAGVIVAHTDPTMLGKTFAGGIPPMGTVRTYTDSAGKPAGNDFISPVTAGEGGTIGYFQLGISSSRYQMLLKDIIINMLMVTLAAIVAGIMLARVMAGRLLKQPIADLSAATEHIAAGDFAHQVPVRQLDELGSLATAFNMMSGHLANLFMSVRTSTTELARSSQAILNRSDAIKLAAENAYRGKNSEQPESPDVQDNPDLNIKKLLEAQQEITVSAKKMVRLVDRLNSLALQFKL